MRYPRPELPAQEVVPISADLALQRYRSHTPQPVTARGEEFLYGTVDRVHTLVSLGGLSFAEASLRLCGLPPQRAFWGMPAADLDATAWTEVTPPGLIGACSDEDLLRQHPARVGDAYARCWIRRAPGQLWAVTEVTTYVVDLPDGASLRLDITTALSPSLLSPWRHAVHTHQSSGYLPCFDDTPPDAVSAWLACHGYTFSGAWDAVVPGINDSDALLAVEARS